MHPEQTTPPTPAPVGATRRQVLRTATVGVAAAFLAGCGKEEVQSGQSGTPVATTSVTPTVPTTVPSAAALEEDETLLRTGTSLELLAADVYGTYGPKLENADWKAAAARFRTDHEAAAEAFTTATAVSKRIVKPNQFVQEHDIDPVADTLTEDKAILDLFHDLESTLVATYVTAAGTFTSPAWRARVMTFGSASARRVGVLGDGGRGAVPSDARYPVTDLISDEAYLLSNPKQAEK